MKKIFFLLLIFVSLKSLGQYPILQTIGSDSTMVKSNGAFWGKTGLVNGVYTDTTTANLYRISQYPGAQIMTLDETLWIRNSLADAWLQFGNVGGGGSDSAFVRHRNVSIDTLRLYRLSGDSSDVLFDVTAFGSLSDSTLQHATDESIEVGDNPFINAHNQSFVIDSVGYYQVQNKREGGTGTFLINGLFGPYEVSMESAAQDIDGNTYGAEFQTVSDATLSGTVSTVGAEAIMGDSTHSHFINVRPNYIELDGAKSYGLETIPRTVVRFKNIDTLLIDPPYIAAFDGDTLKKIPYVAGGGGGAIITFVSVPGTPTSPGTTGTMAFDANFLYVCISTNTWTRVARATGW